MTDTFRKRTFTFPSEQAPARPWRVKSGRVAPVIGGGGGGGGVLNIYPPPLNSAVAPMRRGASSEEFATGEIATNTRIIQLLTMDDVPDTPVAPISTDEESTVRLRLVESFRKKRPTAKKGSGSEGRNSEVDATDDDEDEDDSGGARETDRMKPSDTPSAKITNEDPNCFINAVKLTVSIGKVFSAMPTDLYGTRFSWSSARTVYAGFVSAGLLFHTITWLIFRIQGDSSLVALMVVGFYGMTAVISILFMRLARHWGVFVREFRRQEGRHGCLPGLGRKLNSISILMLSTAAVEHGLSETNGLVELARDNPNATFAEYMHYYYVGNYQNLNAMMPYWPPVALVCFFLNICATFFWNYNDLFIIVVSACLSGRFRMLRSRLMENLQTQQGASPGYWRTARKSFNSLHRMTRVLDGLLSPHFMVSFLNNLYFICMQLLLGFKPTISNVYRTVYILVSFGFLVGRTCAVSLFAASVHEESRMFKDVLYAVPSQDYNQEVYRFLVHATSENIALTGSGMFKVTRSLLLTVAGTILTYEIVLVQLH